MATALAEYALPLALLIVAGGVLAAILGVNNLLPSFAAGSNNGVVTGSKVDYHHFGYGPNGSVSGSGDGQYRICDKETGKCITITGSLEDALEAAAANGDLHR